LLGNSSSKESGALLVEETAEQYGKKISRRKSEADCFTRANEIPIKIRFILALLSVICAVDLLLKELCAVPQPPGIKPWCGHVYCCINIYIARSTPGQGIFFLGEFIDKLS